MSFEVLADSRGVVLPTRVPCPEGQNEPLVKGLVVVGARASGLPSPFHIDRLVRGIPRPFEGDVWCYAWRRDDEKYLALWLGFPDLVFSTSVDPLRRMAIEVMGENDRRLARLEIAIRPRRHANLLPNEATWVPSQKVPLYPLS